MGKSFKRFSKALSLILAAAMVVSCVPTSAYAAELLTAESEELLTSNDVVEAGETLVEDNSTEVIEDTQDVLAEDSADIMDENIEEKSPIVNAVKSLMNLFK